MPSVASVLLPSVLVLAAVPFPGPPPAQAGPQPATAAEVDPTGEVAADSFELRDRARDAQARFERARTRFSPRSWRPSGGSCDEIVGRMCLRFDPDGPVYPQWTPPEEDLRLTEARRELLDVLGEVAAGIPGDPWVLAQRVLYLGESGDWTGARELAIECLLPGHARWWCHALEGVARHRLEEFPAALTAFRRALEAMPAETRDAWEEPTLVLSTELRDAFAEIPEEGRTGLEHRFWTLADPLFLVPGRDRESEHYTRLVLAHARDEAATPYRMSWSDDLSEILVRYGPALHFEVPRGDPLRAGRSGVVGLHDPRAWGTLPTAAQLARPGAIPPGSWATDQRSGRSYYAPSYAATIQPIEVQQARFRRGDDLFVVLGWTASDRWSEEGRLAPDTDVSLAAVESGPERTPTAEGERFRPAEGLFLVPEERLSDNDGTLEPVGEIRAWMPGRDEGAAVRGDDLATRPAGVGSGVATARVPVGRYLVSLELLDRGSRKGWRARHGVSLAPLPRGVVEVSDLLLLEVEESTDAAGSGVSTPREPAFDQGGRGDRLEDHLDRVTASRRVPPGPVEVAWEVYGLSAADSALRFRVTAEPAERGLLRRAAEFLRLAGGPERVEVSWSEGVDASRTGGPAAAVFRRMVMDLGAMPPGPVRLTLSLELPGRTAATAETLVELVEEGALPR